MQRIDSNLITSVAEIVEKTFSERTRVQASSEAISLSLFRVALEAAVLGRYGDWLRLFSQFKGLLAQKLNSLSLFDKRLVRWVETKGRTLGCEEKDRRSTMMAFNGSSKILEEMTRDELLFFFLDTLDHWAAKVGQLLSNDEQAARSLRNDALSKLKLLEWADPKTIATVIKRTQEDTLRLAEAEQNMVPRHRSPQKFK